MLNLLLAFATVVVSRLNSVRDTAGSGVLSCVGVPNWSDQLSGRRLRVLLSRVQLRLTFGELSAPSSRRRGTGPQPRLLQKEH